MFNKFFFIWTDYGPVESGNGPEDPTQYEQLGEFQKINSILVDGGDRYGVSALTIDTHEELIWIGNQGVRENKFA